MVLYLTPLTSQYITATLHRLTEQRLSLTDAIIGTDYPTSIPTYIADDLRRNARTIRNQGWKLHHDGHSTLSSSGNTLYR